MKAVEIKKGIYWVGAIDWDLRNFHGYLTQRGSTYNAFLVIDEKITLIDAVKPGFEDEMMARISQVIDPSKIDVVISNHVELDHSGCIPHVIEKNPDAVIVTNPAGERGLKAHFGEGYNYHVVKTGDSYSIGKRSFHFVLTPMVHWPDNMLTYMPEEKILFSNDAFGQHLASSERFDDEYPADIIVEEARKYYANIVLPYSGQVRKALETAKGIDIKMIAPSHGIIWKNNVKKIFDLYDEWSSGETKKKALICYDTMWGSTLKMARAIQNAFEEKGYVTELFNLQVVHMSDVMTNVIDAEYICIGSPTLNRNMLPTVAAFLTYLKGLTPKGKKSFTFGSYGWGSVSMKEVNTFLESCGVEIKETFEKKFIPNEDTLKEIEEKVKSYL